MHGPLNIKYDGYHLKSMYFGIVFFCSKVSKRSALTQTFLRYVSLVIQIYTFDSNMQYAATVLLLTVTTANTKPISICF